MPPELQIVFAAMSAAISVLFGALMLLYREALANERDRNAAVLKEIADAVRQIAGTTQAIDRDNERTADAVEGIQAELRVAGIAASRRLGP